MDSNSMKLFLAQQKEAQQAQQRRSTGPGAAIQVLQRTTGTTSANDARGPHHPKGSNRDHKLAQQSDPHLHLCTGGWRNLRQVVWKARGHHQTGRSRSR
uniref:Uncharacterized protein n=1 Tax=Caenorhabditis japonica TaxID=281687 RepID=A0A8R1E7G9_CAEJA